MPASLDPLYLRDGFAPVLTLIVIGWIVSRTDRIVNAVFPDLEWERSLGWLNIRAERRASWGMRWVRVGVIVLLLDSLAIMFWAVKGLPRLSDWADPWVMGDLALRVPTIGLCLLIWVIYLGLGLLPRLRAEREAAAYKKFRAEMQSTDEELEWRAPSRHDKLLTKPRANSPTMNLTPERKWRRHPPGG